MVPWNKNYNLYPHAHPSFVRLIILGREYAFKFLDPFERGTFPDLNIAYKGVRVQPSRMKGTVNTFEDNNIILWPPEGFTLFTSVEISRLKLINNPHPCEVRSKKRIFFCQIV